MHTAEHILNSVMDKMYHCGRSFNSHIESKKSKCDYHIRKGLSDKEVTAVERTVNEIIKLKIPVGEELVGQAPSTIAVEKVNAGMVWCAEKSRA